VQHLQASQPQFKSSKLYYHAPDKFNGIDLEILNTPQSSWMFLIVHSHPITCCDEEKQFSYVYLSSDSFQIKLKAVRHAGGQRLLLPPLIYPLIIATLKANKPLLVTMGGYSAEISPHTFIDKYNKLQHPPNFIIPFRLPF